jgi:acyl dehydratase
MEQIRWVMPVRSGDALRSARRSQSRPDRGIIFMDTTGEVYAAVEAPKGEFEHETDAL